MSCLSPHPVADGYRPVCPTEDISEGLSFLQRSMKVKLFEGLHNSSNSPSADSFFISPFPTDLGPKNNS